MCVFHAQVQIDPPTTGFLSSNKIQGTLILMLEKPPAACADPRNSCNKTKESSFKVATLDAQRVLQ